MDCPEFMLNLIISMGNCTVEMIKSNGSTVINIIKH